MGIKFGKQELIMGDSFPLSVVDTRYAGGCYLYVHDQGELIEKHKHHSLSVDVAGESRVSVTGEIDKLCGVMLHVTANSTGKSQFGHGKAMVSGRKGSIYFIGQLANTRYEIPGEWVSHLINAGEENYKDLVEHNNGAEQWDANLNCQVFVQKLVKYLDLDYLSSILTCVDIPPTIVELTILAIRSSAHSQEKL
ncbi:unnamed protein product [Adineta ricciae]|uniref:Uncharacterized protein n=1 Tax=Adineta ricciae TaxID=249248 RepID=A0A815ZUY0_ADIRI|nr:unnamed protein product [Adineta ricciae]CAF1589403.1 unnamed protein product [Adineta ricciae]